MDKDVLWRLLGILDENIEVSIVVEDARIKQLVFHIATIAPFAGSHQVLVGKRGLGIFVQVLHVRMGWCAIDVEVILFDILAMIAFAVG